VAEKYLTVIWNVYRVELNDYGVQNNAKSHNNAVGSASHGQTDRRWTFVVKVSSVVGAVSAARRLLHPVSDIKERQSGPVPVRKAHE
jgi:hypothetical protein